MFIFNTDYLSPSATIGILYLLLHLALNTLSWCCFKLMYCDAHVTFLCQNSYTPIFLNHPCTRIIIFNSGEKVLPYRQFLWYSKPFEIFCCSASMSHHCFDIQIMCDILCHHTTEFRCHTASACFLNYGCDLYGSQINCFPLHPWFSHMKTGPQVINKESFVDRGQTTCASFLHFIKVP